MSKAIPSLHIVAGPNGAGKTTFATQFLPKYASCKEFVNADLIAKGLSPFDPEASAFTAGRLVLKRIRELIEKKIDFGFETTLSGRTYLSIISQAKIAGYRVHIYFLWLPESQLALKRISNRVKEGGHNVPAMDVRRRFKLGPQNFFNGYAGLADLWIIFDNSGKLPKLIAKYENQRLQIKKEKIFYLFQEMGRMK